MSTRESRVLLALLSFSVLLGSATAGPRFVEKQVKAAMVMADSDSETVPLIVEGWNSVDEIRGLLGASARQDLHIIQAVSGEVPVGKIRELLASDAVKAIYHDSRVELVKPMDDDEVNEVAGGIFIPTEGQLLPREEAQAEMTYGLRLIQAPQAEELVRKVRQAYAAQGVELPKVRVGIVDTGIDGNHRSFQGAIQAFSDLSSDFSPEPRDDNGHGTHVAGTIAGGMSPDGIRIGVVSQDLVELYVARGLNPYGRDSWLISSLAWMADPDRDPTTDDGVHVINNSWGGSSRRPVYDRLIKALTDMGITCVFAAGNSGPYAGTVGSPGHLADALTVGAVDWRKRVAPFSSRGDQIVNSAEIPVKPDVCAPGVSIYSVAPHGAFERWNGTSMAAPHVTGVVALMKAVNPMLRPRDVKLLLEQTAEDLGPAGKDEDFGSGLVDALAAVQAALDLADGKVQAEDPAELIQQAKDYMRNRQTQYAVDNLFRVINAYPNLDLEKKIEAGYLMGEAFRELGNLKGAMESYKGVSMFDPNSPFAPKAEYWMAWLYQNVRGGNVLAHLEEAVRRYRQFVADNEDHEWMPLASMELAKTLMELNRDEEAAEALTEMLEKRPHTEHRLNAMEMLQELSQKGDELDF